MDRGLPLFSDMPGDLEGGGFSGFNTPSRNRQMASGLTFNMNKGPTTPLPPPPKTDKGKRNKQYCTTIEDLPEDDDKEEQPLHTLQYIPYGILSKTLQDIWDIL
ncbi:hypothetical protein PCASD_21107 [Puccinia coronata f. sp. avenae]|uniref:Uncharacterized protein n=1 Tax=Puccinia coronata f. sp. avenae TaxID=200324 RepID=A0A2N5T270_9BASI|nr:hypothetical protein PCASD_21107 [Puccinia coronata f. sp. avenae]